ncbi:MAG: hypothetical protein J2P45_07600, partial [Candidatus Dormibacteraeota bacterium]|nr:hypothetical protein [Candidatus Dormibacteraeota bacterium]
MSAGTCMRAGRRLALAATGAAAFTLVASSGAGAAGAGPGAPGRGGSTAPHAPIAGFLLDRGHYLRFEVPGSTLNFPLGVNDRGQVVGYYDDPAGVTHGFLRHEGGRTTTIDVPGALISEAFAINDHGQIVGEYQESGPGGTPGPQIGFLRDEGGRVTSLRFPDATYTEAHGINDRGQVVGEYGDTAGAVHGFRWEQGRFT